MAYPSRKRLHEALEVLKSDGVCPHVVIPEDYREMSNEVYGREAYIYVGFDHEGKKRGDPELFRERRRTEAALEARGFRCNRQYCTKAGRCQSDDAVMEVRVAYFRGYHWDC